MFCQYEEFNDMSLLTYIISYCKSSFEISTSSKSIILCNISQVSENFSSDKLWYTHRFFAYMWYIFSFSLIKKYPEKFLLFCHRIIYHHYENSEGDSKYAKNLIRITYQPSRKNDLPEIPVGSSVSHFFFPPPFRMVLLSGREYPPLWIHLTPIFLLRKIFMRLRYRSKKTYSVG